MFNGGEANRVELSRTVAEAPVSAHSRERDSQYPNDVVREIRENGVIFTRVLKFSFSCSSASVRD